MTKCLCGYHVCLIEARPKQDLLMYATDLVAQVERGEITMTRAVELYEAYERAPKVEGQVM